MLSKHVFKFNSRQTLIERVSFLWQCVSSDQIFGCWLLLRIGWLRVAYSLGCGCPYRMFMCFESCAFFGLALFSQHLLVILNIFRTQLNSCGFWSEHVVLYCWGGGGKKTCLFLNDEKNVLHSGDSQHGYMHDGQNDNQTCDRLR